MNKLIYAKIENIEAGVFLDYYISPKFVVNAKLGYTISHDYELFDMAEQNINNAFTKDVDNTFYFSIGISYRLRFD